MKDSKKKEIFLANWRDEMEAVMLYSQMAEQEPEPDKKSIYKRLAQIEKNHAKIWADELKKLGVTPSFKPRLKARILSFFGKILGHKSLLEVLEQGEGGAVGGYSSQLGLIEDPKLKKELKKMIPDEKSHSMVLTEMGAKSTGPMQGERWHQGGDSIRDIIFGMNDGLLSTFSLVAGVAGGVSNNAIVLLAGLAGAVAGAISMAAGAYISTKSEKEVYEKHVEMEKSELEMMPKAEEEELALMYELKGINTARSKKIAKKIMSNQSIALRTMAKEELGFDPEELGDPMKAGISSGVSFTIGASVPILPWVILPGTLALYVSIILSLGGFFVIGAGRTLVTGKNPVKSGLEMFLIGTIAAIITYAIGSFLGVSV
jgi:VIT1/CCC1 family predicted Fe2+/Mn2+ transporter